MQFSSSPLTNVDRDLLDFEDSWVPGVSRKDEEILARFELSAARYYQRLNALIDDPAALAYRPTLVRRLQQAREELQAARSARRLG